MRVLASLYDLYAAAWLAVYGIVVWCRVLGLPPNERAALWANELGPYVPACIALAYAIDPDYRGAGVLISDTITMIVWLTWVFGSDNDGRWRRRAQRATGAVRRRFARLVVAHDAG